jgi:DNA (cytosine-5)-methyltransferase 1
LFENVQGLASGSSLPYFQYIVSQLSRPFERDAHGEGWQKHAARLASSGSNDAPEKHFYDVHWRIYNVADFGIPQQRHRVFIVGFRRDLAISWAFPTPTHSKEALLFSQYVDGSYWREHGLPARDVPEALSATVERLARSPKPTEARWRTVRDALSGLPDPRDQGRASVWNAHAFVPDARPYAGHSGSPWDWPAKALKAGDHGNPGGENMLRNDDGTVRYFTVRELARLQTFPDCWHFGSSWTESRRQLGNAVPVEVARQLAHQMRTALQPNSPPTFAAQRELSAVGVR